jgi:hypothetical protein
MIDRSSLCIDVITLAEGAIAETTLTGNVTLPNGVLAAGVWVNDAALAATHFAGRSRQRNWATRRAYLAAIHCHYTHAIAAEDPKPGGHWASGTVT